VINGNTSDGYKSRARHLKFFLDQEKYFIALEQMDCNSRLRDEQQRAIMQAITIHNSNSATGSNPPSDCICNAGFYEEFAGSRNACEAGKYTSAGGQQACANCVAGKYSDAIGATHNVCASCPANSMSSVGSGAIYGCTCNPGYSEEAGNVCSACDTGKFKDL